MGLTDVGHCAEPGCDVHAIAYEASERQLNALISLSEQCFQEISVRTVPKRIIVTVHFQKHPSVVIY